MKPALRRRLGFLLFGMAAALAILQVVALVQANGRPGVARSWPEVALVVLAAAFVIVLGLRMVRRGVFRPGPRPPRVDEKAP